MRNIHLAFAAAALSLGSAASNATTDVVTGVSAIYSAATPGTPPPNGFIFLNNLFGKGQFVEGVDFTSKLTAHRETFPNDATIEWAWPDATSGSAFAYAYPEIIYGGTPWGNALKAKGPWPQKINSISDLRASYDITLGGNPNSYNVLIDLYVTATPDSSDGSHVAEISFFPHLDDPGGLSGIHDFRSFGRASVRRQGGQILVRPVTAADRPRDLLAANVDMKEVIDYLIGMGMLTGNEYLRGIEFGAEVQVPNRFNSTPHVGALKISKLRYDWR